MLPHWGGYYWHYDAALDACERYIWDEWNREIRDSEEILRQLSEDMEDYRTGGQRPLFAWVRNRLQRSYNYLEYKVPLSELEQYYADGPEIIRLKRQMCMKELALVWEARERIRRLFQQLNATVLAELDVFGEDGRAIPEAWLEAGLLAFDGGDPILSWRYLVNLIESWDSDHSHRVLQEVRSLYAKACLETNEYLEAVEVLSQVLKEDPTKKEAHLDRAQAYFELGFFDLAKSDFLDSGTRLIPIDRGRDRLDMAVGLVDGMIEGLSQALAELGPSLLDSAKGIGHGLWACATDPEQVSIELVHAALDIFEFIKEHSAGEIFETIAPEISGLVHNWDSLSPQERGEGMGRIIGRYGTDILAVEGGIGAIKRVRKLKRLDVCATLDVVATGGQRSERLLTQAATYGERRTFVADESLKALGSTEARGGVYLLRDPKTEDVMRSGRTNDFARRQYEHQRDPKTRPFDFEVEYRTDVYNEQRGLEKIAHEQYKPPLNKIRPISPRNPKRAIYEAAAYRYQHLNGTQP
jgi:tetratricopeptide (TPR) repeat protein